MSTSITKIYRVIDGDDHVYLTINIGHAQPGVTSIFLAGKELKSGIKSDIDKLDLGPGKELKSKTLYCTTTVTDIRPETNQTSVKYELTGGLKKFENKYSESVDNDGETISYMASFYFFV